MLKQNTNNQHTCNNSHHFFISYLTWCHCWFWYSFRVMWINSSLPESTYNIFWHHCRIPCRTEYFREFRFSEAASTVCIIVPRQMVLPPFFKLHKWDWVKHLQQMRSVCWDSQDFNVIITHCLIKWQVVDVRPMPIHYEQIRSVCHSIRFQVMDEA